jgi:hypothetical protein
MEQHVDPPPARHIGRRIRTQQVPHSNDRFIRCHEQQQGCPAAPIRVPFAMIL